MRLPIAVVLAAIAAFVPAAAARPRAEPLGPRLLIARGRETSYGNDASLLVRISWPEGRHAAPRVSRLRVCGKERC